MNRKEFFLVARTTIKGSAKDDVNLLAAGLTYYVFLSIFPLLLLGLTLLGNVLGQKAAMDLVFNTVSQMVPGATKLLQSIVVAAYENRDFYYLIGVATLAYSASAAFGTLDKAINRAWKTEKVPTFIVAKLFSFLMMLVFAVLLGLLFVSSAISSTTRSFANSLLGDLPGGALFWNLLDIAVSLAVVFLIFALMYRFVPRIDVLWRDVWLAALLAAIAWVTVKKGFAVYLDSSFASYDVVYGTLGTVVALLFWLYVSSIIILYGAEFASETYNIRARHAQVVEQISKEQITGERRDSKSPWFSTLKR